MLWRGLTVEEFLAQVSRGFQRSQWEVILTIVLAVAFVVFLVVIFIIQQHRNRQRRLKAAEQRFQTAVGDKDLSEFEIELIRRMADTLPDGQLAMGRVASEERTFNHAAGKLIEAGKVSPEVIAAMRIKLGFLRPPANKQAETGQG